MPLHIKKLGRPGRTSQTWLPFYLGALVINYFYLLAPTAPQDLRRRQMWPLKANGGQPALGLMNKVALINARRGRAAQVSPCACPAAGSHFERLGNSEREREWRSVSHSYRPHVAQISLHTPKRFHVCLFNLCLVFLQRLQVAPANEPIVGRTYQADFA